MQKMDTFLMLIVAIIFCVIQIILSTVNACIVAINAVVVIKAINFAMGLFYRVDSYGDCTNNSC